MGQKTHKMQLIFLIFKQGILLFVLFFILNYNNFFKGGGLKLPLVLNLK